MFSLFVYFNFNCKEYKDEKGFLKCHDPKFEWVW